MHIEPELLTGAGTLLVGGTSFLTWVLVRREKASKAGSQLIDDALKLQSAAQDAYDDARQEMEDLREDAKSARKDINDLRGLIGEIMAELNHWRAIAGAARDEYKGKFGTEPPWYKPFPNEKKEEI